MKIEFAFQPGQWPLWVALGVGVLALIYFLLARADAFRARRLHAFVEAHLAPRLLEGYDVRLQRPLRWCILLGTAFLLLAFAQPKWGQGILALGREGRDVLILLDTSESMNAANPAPTRLAKARQKIESLIEELPADRVGLVAFSGSAVVSCPLTLDHAHLKNALLGVDTNTIDEEGTNIEAALNTAARVFQEDAEKSGEDSRQSRAIVLISDGEQVSGDAVARAAALKDIASVYVIGIGDPNGALVNYPEYNMYHESRGGLPTPSERQHLSKLDETSLGRIATEGQGMYVRVTPDNTDVGLLLQAFEGLSSRAVSGDLRFNLVNRYQWPLAVAIAFFAMEGLWLVLMAPVRHWWLRRQLAREVAANV
jgi:Ca-activated chloride channel family protein